jgi:uncharacterized membrane protein YhaH (DUF805 family)
MNIINWYKTVVLENYANFNGRARRSEYWYFILVHIIIFVILGLVDEALGLNFGISDVYMVATLVPNIAVAIRRMHDVGKSGWFILIPIYNFILTVTEGEKGSNEYGQDPKNAEMDAVDHLVE